MARTFKGGARPWTARGWTSNKAISDIPVPPRVVLPLSQHVGSPARPLVAVGDRVVAGAKVGEADGFVSAAVHASISGRVTAIGDFPHPNGRLMPAIVIEASGAAEEPPPAPAEDLSSADPETIREAVREAGIVGLGGGAFPSHVKLTPPESARIDTVVLNGAECEPGLNGDRRLMAEDAETVVDGLAIIMRAVGAGRGLVGIERDKPDAAARVRAASRRLAGAEVVDLKVKYPQGAEKVLIKVLTGREVPRGGLPADVGCVVHNVGTSHAISEAVRRGRPLTTRVVTLAGSAAASPGIFRVRLGTPVAHVIASAGGLRGRLGLVVLGGPMMGVAQATTDVPVVKGTTGVILVREEDVPRREPGPCIRCGRCVDRCPVGLMPNDLVRFVERERMTSAADYGIADCIECGVCAYVCPAGIDHVSWMRLGKAAVSKAGTRS